MDAASIVAIVVAFVAALPGLLSLYNQGKKEKEQLELDKERMRTEANTNAQNTLMSMLQPLRDEVARLQGRVAELEATIADKNNQIATLTQSLFDKDVKIRTMQYAMDGLKMRLDTVENAAATTPDAKRAIKKVRLETEAEEGEYNRRAIEEATAELHIIPPPIEGE